MLGAVLYVTTAEPSGNRLLAITDSGPASPATVLATSSPSQVLSGVRFGSTPAPAAVSSDPQSQTVFAGQTVVFRVGVSARSGPYFFQWQFNSGSIQDATNATLVLNNVSAANIGSYSVLVSNLLTSTTSGTALLNVLDRPKFTATTFLGPGSGLKLNFTGPAGTNYTIWMSQDVSLSPVQTTWSQLTTGAFTGGDDSYTDVSAGNNPAQFYLLSVP